MIVTAKLIPQTRIRRCCEGEANIERERDKQLGRECCNYEKSGKLLLLEFGAVKKKKKQRRVEGNGARLDLQAYSNVIKRVLVF